MTFMIELVITVLILVGGVFLLVGSLGLIKLPDLMARLHGPTKATTLGIGSTLLASMFYFLGIAGAPSVHEILIIAFLFLTAPVTAHFIAKAYLHEYVRDGKGLPPTGRGCGWSTFDATTEGSGDPSGTRGGDLRGEE